VSDGDIRSGGLGGGGGSDDGVDRSRTLSDGFDGGGVRGAKTSSDTDLRSGGSCGGGVECSD
jgi:hypothetical protein